MQRSGKSLHNALLFVLALALALGVRVAGAWGQELVGEADIAGEASVGGQYGAPADIAAPQPTSPGEQQGPAQATTALRIRAFKGFQGLADSPDMKGMLKRMITAQVPVMYQTMMMVENGAATGFMGSMHTVSNLMDNQMQAAALELSLRLASPDSTDGGAVAFVHSMQAGINQQGGNNNNFPAALMAASGDSMQQLENQEKLEQVKPNERGGAQPVDAMLNEEGRAGEVVPPGQAELLLVENLLFRGITSPSAGQSTPDQQNLRDILDYIGDLKFSTQDADSIVPRTISEWKSAEKGGEVPGYEGQKRGMLLYEYEQKKEVWKAWYETLNEYCKFKKDNSKNKGVEIFKKATPASVVTPDMLKKASARDVRLSINLIDVLFKLFVHSANHEGATELDCSSFDNAEDSMPTKYTAPKDVVDNCKTNPQDCLRNKVLYRLVEMVARSRRVEFFKGLYLALLEKAEPQKNFLSAQVESLMCKSMERGNQDKVQFCDPLTILEIEGEINRERWVRHITELTKFAQFTGGSAVFRGIVNRDSAFNANEAGFDSSANQNPDAGGGG